MQRKRARNRHTRNKQMETEGVVWQAQHIVLARSQRLPLFSARSRRRFAVGSPWSGKLPNGTAAQGSLGLNCVAGAALSQGQVQISWRRSCEERKLMQKDLQAPEFLRFAAAQLESFVGTKLLRLSADFSRPRFRRASVCRRVRARRQASDLCKSDAGGPHARSQQQREGMRLAVQVGDALDELASTAQIQCAAVNACHEVPPKHIALGTSILTQVSSLTCFQVWHIVSDNEVQFYCQRAACQLNQGTLPDSMQMTP